MEWGAQHAERWRWQCESLADLGEFLREHAPGTALFLPPVPWRVGTERTVAATLTEALVDPELVPQYARVLGVPVRRETRADHAVWRVTWRIGPTDPDTGMPRTRCVLAVRITPPAVFSR